MDGGVVLYRGGYSSQPRMGHSSISVTADIYTHVDIGLQNVALDAFEQSMSDA